MNPCKKVGACGSAGQDSYNQSLKLLEVQEGKWEIRRKMTRRLLEEQDKILILRAEVRPGTESGGENGTHHGAGRRGIYWPHSARLYM